MSDKKLKRASTISNIISTKIERIKFTGRFYDVFGHPQRKGRWFIYGPSGSGKSSFVMQLLKEFARTEKTLLVSKEEGLDDENLQSRVKTFQMQDVASNIAIVEDNLTELDRRLSKRGSAQIIFIDSAMYLFSSYEEYLQFTRKYADKLFVVIGHGKGMQPRTEFEHSINFDATQKVVVSGYVATNKGRKYGPLSTQYIVWQKGYEDLHGVTNSKMNDDEDT
ncbi:AAA family ATPase [Myroides sp. LJL116]